MQHFRRYPPHSTNISTYTEPGHWYLHRNQLQCDMIFACDDTGDAPRIVQLEQRTEGDGTRWDVSTWCPHRKKWYSEPGDTIEPSDLIGNPLPAQQYPTPRA